MIRRVVSRMKSVSVSRAFEDWWGSCENRRHTQHLLKRAQVHSHVRFHARFFARWATTSHNQRVVKRIIGRMRMVSSASAFECWHANAAELRYYANAVARLQRGFNACKARSSFLVWHTVARDLKRLVRVSSRIMTMRLQLVWDAWTVSVGQRQIIEDRARVIIRQMLSQAMAWVFERWLAYAIERTDHRILSVKLERSSSRHQYFSAFARWSDFVTELHRVKTVCSRVLARMLNATLSFAVCTWTSWVADAKQQRHHSAAVALVLRVVARRSPMRRSFYWEIWKSFSKLQVSTGNYLHAHVTY